MATGPTILRHLRRALFPHDARDMTDGQLLECFLTRREEAAFEALLRRHGPMVLGVCRRVLGNAADAEDAFQATFLVLVRKAASVVPRELVGNWLYGVAYRTALKARSGAARRRLKEREVAAMPRQEPPPDSWSDLQPVLDQELSRLPDRYRTPVVLCDLEGKGRKEVARQLRLPEGTVSSRLARGRRLLATRLARHGVGPSVGALSVLIARQATAGVPARLLSSTLRAATQLAAGQALAAGVVSARVAALTEGVLKAMLVTRLKVLTAVLLAAAAVGAGTVLLTRPALADKPADKAAGAPRQAAAKEKPDTGPTIHGTVTALDEAKHKLTLAVPRAPDKKETAEKTLDLAGDLKVLLHPGLVKEEKPGRLADVTPGTPVDLDLSADQKSVRAIHVHGRSLHGGVEAVDAARNRLTVTVKEAGGAQDRTVTLLDGAKVLLDDGLTKGGAKEGKLADLSEGLPVVVQLSAGEKDRAVSVHASGRSLFGTVKGVDAGNNTITVTVKDEGGVTDRTLTLAKGVKVEGGTLAELAAGTPVSVRLSVVDKQTAVSVHVHKGNEE
jgi:RNA polymerase sigma factor (sigma-70 family)